MLQFLFLRATFRSIFTEERKRSSAKNALPSATQIKVPWCFVESLP